MTLNVALHKRDVDLNPADTITTHELYIHRIMTSNEKINKNKKKQIRGYNSWEDREIKI